MTTTPTTPDMQTSEPRLGQLADLLRGRLLTAVDEDYARLATPWNVAVPSAPLAVAEVVDAWDVSIVLRFAADAGWDAVVQLTGHGAVRHDRPTVLIHTGLLDEVVIDPAGAARVGAGVRWGRVLAAAAPFGLAGLAGSAPDVGVVGYLTGGGLGPVARTFGVASDRVTAIDVVTGDGVVRRATPTVDPDLFWGLRGGKGALGIITGIEFDLLPVSEIYGGCLYFDGGDHGVVEALVQRWRVWASSLPDAATTSLAVLRLPPLPSVPPPLAGRCAVAVRFAWVGDAATGAEVAAPVAGFGPVVLGGLDVMPYEALGRIHADPVDPMPSVEHSTLLADLSADAVTAWVQLVGPAADCPQVVVELRQLGGAIAGVGSSPSAVCHREAAFSLLAIGIAAPPVLSAVRAHAARLSAAMESWSTGGTLPNFAATADPAQIRRNWDRATLQRLGDLCERYDPCGVLAASGPVRAAAAALG